MVTPNRSEIDAVDVAVAASMKPNDRELAECAARSASWFRRRWIALLARVGSDSAHHDGRPAAATRDTARVIDASGGEELCQRSTVEGCSRGDVRDRRAASISVGRRPQQVGLSFWDVTARVSGGMESIAQK